MHGIFSMKSLLMLFLCCSGAGTSFTCLCSAVQIVAQIVSWTDITVSSTPLQHIHSFIHSNFLFLSHSDVNLALCFLMTTEELPHGPSVYSRLKKVLLQKLFVFCTIHSSFFQMKNMMQPQPNKGFVHFYNCTSIAPMYLKSSKHFVSIA